jgi:hypothetical protein
MKQDPKQAEFDVSAKGRVYLPSVIYPEETQACMIESAGLALKQIEYVPLSALRGERISWKLRETLAPDDAVVVGYLATKAN